MSGFVHWLDTRQRRHPILGGPLAVVYKFFDDQGFYLSALIAFYAFLSLFPLFLLFSTILGFALENDPHLRTQILESAARQIPVIGQQIETHELRGSGTAVAIAKIGEQDAVVSGSAPERSNRDDRYQGSNAGSQRRKTPRPH